MKNSIRINSIIGVCVLFFGCISSKEQEAINLVAKFTHAEIVKLGSEIIEGTGRERMNIITLNIKGGDILNNANVDNESISSMSALLFYNNLDSQILVDKDCIKLIMERQFNGFNKRIEKVYYIDTLLLVKQSSLSCQKLGLDFSNQNYSDIYNHLFNDIQANTRRMDFESTLTNLDEKYGTTDSFIIIKYITYTKTQNDGRPLPFIKWYVELKRKDMSNYVELTYCLSKDINGILDLNIK